MQQSACSTSRATADRQSQAEPASHRQDALPQKERRPLLRVDRLAGHRPSLAATPGQARAAADREAVPKQQGPPHPTCPTARHRRAQTPPPPRVPITLGAHPHPLDRRQPATVWSCRFRPHPQPVGPRVRSTLKRGSQRSADTPRDDSIRLKAWRALACQQFASVKQANCRRVVPSFPEGSAGGDARLQGTASLSALAFDFQFQHVRTPTHGPVNSLSVA